MIFLLRLLLISSFSRFFADGANLAEIDQLYEDLFYNYLKLSRPVKNNSEAVEIQFSAMLVRIIDVDEKSQVLTINLLIEMMWTDYRLTWNPTIYGGAKRINIPADQIWLPDIVLYNNADGNPQITAVTDAFVYFDGQVIWTTPQIYKSFCEIDVTYFPYDSQKCKLKFGAWSHDGFHLSILQQVSNSNETPIQIIDPEDAQPGDFLMSGMDLSYFQPSQEWDLLNLTSIRRQRIYSGCCGPLNYIDITYWLTLRRKALFYTVNLVIPCMFVAFLTTFVFYLTDHKVTFAISVLVALSVFFLVLIDLIPANSEVIPLFGEYLLFTLFLVILSIGETIVVLNVQHRDSTTHEMPNWVRVVFLYYLPRLLRMKLPSWHKPDAKLEEMKKQIKQHGAFNERFRGSYNRRPSPYFLSAKEAERQKRLIDMVASKGMHPSVVTEMIKNISSIADHFAMLEEEGNGKDEWSYVAYVIDRLFFVLFSIINIIGSILIISKAPILYDTVEPLTLPTSPIRPLGGDVLTKKYI